MAQTAAQQHWALRRVLEAATDGPTALSRSQRLYGKATVYRALHDDLVQRADDPSLYTLTTAGWAWLARHKEQP